MDSITLKDGTTIYYKDWGTGQPLFFHHGWPLSADDWDGHIMFFLERGFRVIAHDRRDMGAPPERSCARAGILAGAGYPFVSRRQSGQ